VTESAVVQPLLALWLLHVDAVGFPTRAVARAFMVHDAVREAHGTGFTHPTVSQTTTSTSTVTGYWTTPSSWLIKKVRAGSSHSSPVKTASSSGSSPRITHARTMVHCSPRSPR